MFGNSWSWLGKNLQLLTVVLETFFPKSSGNVLKSICNETQFKDQSLKVAYNLRQMKSLENLIKLLEVNRDITDGYFVLENVLNLLLLVWKYFGTQLD